jgi:hypothetical protein
MANPLDDIVQVTISFTGATTPSAKGFGIPMILALKDGTFLGNTLEIKSESELLTNGYITTDAEYVAAKQIFAQNPKPERAVIGKVVGYDPLFSVRLTPIAPFAIGKIYTLTFDIGDGTPITITTAATTAATVQDAIDVIEAAIIANATLNALVDLVDNTTSLDITIKSGSQGRVFGITKNNFEMDLVENTAAPAGSEVTTALTNIRNENDDWYAIILPYSGSNLAVDAGIVSVVTNQERLLFFTTLNDDVLKGTGGNIAETLFNAGNKERWSVMFHHNLAQMPHAAWAGKVLPEDPGSVTWAFKSLAGVVAASYTTAEEGKLDDNNVNRYVQISGLSITQRGETSKDGFFIDVMRGIDFIKARMQEAIFGQLATLKKIPFTDPGIAVVENEIRSVLRLGITQGILSSDPEIVVIVPKAADVSTVDKKARTLPDVEFQATLAGAIHKVIIAGTVSV